MANSKKKVLFVITKGNFGGAQRYVFDLATNLPKDDYEVVVACGEGEKLPELLKAKNIKVINIANLTREVSISNDFSVYRELVQILHSEKPDVLHLNSSKIGAIGAVAGKVTSWLEKNYRPKVIFTAHNWGFNDNRRSVFAKIFYLLSHWVTLLLCDEVIAVSEKTKSDVALLPFVNQKIKVIYNGAEHFKTVTKKEAHQFLAPLDTKKTVLFSISELHVNKGIDVALQSISLLPKEKKDRIIYCIAGSGEETESLHTTVSTLKIADQVRWLGFVDDAKKYLSGADIFLLPSRNEAFPYAILEAGLAGLPIISTSVGGIPEVIRDMQNGILVHPKNPKEIAEAIIYLLDHETTRKEFGKEIKKTVENFFSLEKMLTETLALY